MTQRSQFVSTVTRLMSENDRIVLLLADIGVHGFREAFERWPTRCYNTGVTEQATVGIAAGLSKSGLYPVVHTIASFLCRRAYEQIRIDFGEHNLPGLFVGVGSEGYPGLGPTHACPEDMTLMSCVPAMFLYAPRSDDDVDYLIRTAIEDNEMAYMRIAR